MKAVICEKYGPPESLKIMEVKRPLPGPSEVLVRVKATAINDYDWSMVMGKPFLYRLMYGIFKPKNRIIGMELSGVVEEIGKDVKTFKKGDPVFGDTSEYGFGTFAEYACIDYRCLTIKPETMSFEEAVALPHASLLAYQGMVEMGGLGNNQRILINGAGGGVGTIALQLAKLQGADVTGVDTGEKLLNMLDLGFDEVIDYRKEDYTKLKVEYDLILDTKTEKSPFSCARALKDGGNFVTVGGKIGNLLQFVLFKGLIKSRSGKKLQILALKPNKGIDKICDLHAAGKLKCLIDGPYPLQKAAENLRRFGEGKHYGKIILTTGL